MTFDLTGFYFLLASDECELHDDDSSSGAWTESQADLQDWLVRQN